MKHPKLCQTAFQEVRFLVWIRVVCSSIQYDSLDPPVQHYVTNPILSICVSPPIHFKI